MRASVMCFRNTGPRTQEHSKIKLTVVSRKRTCHQNATPQTPTSNPLNKSSINQLLTPHMHHTSYETMAKQNKLNHTRLNKRTIHTESDNRQNKTTKPTKKNANQSITQTNHLTKIQPTNQPTNQPTKYFTFDHKSCPSFVSVPSLPALCEVSRMQLIFDTAAHIARLVLTRVLGLRNFRRSHARRRASQPTLNIPHVRVSAT